MEAPVPGDDVLNISNNHYDNCAFVDTCRLFGVSQEHNAYKQKQYPSWKGLGIFITGQITPT